MRCNWSGGRTKENVRRHSVHGRICELDEGLAQGNLATRQHARSVVSCSFRPVECLSHSKKKKYSKQRSTRQLGHLGELDHFLGLSGDSALALILQGLAESGMKAFMMMSKYI